MDTLDYFDALEAVETNGALYRFLDTSKKKIPAIARAAVQNNFNALEYIPSELKVDKSFFRSLLDIEDIDKLSLYDIFDLSLRKDRALLLETLDKIYIEYALIDDAFEHDKEIVMKILRYQQSSGTFFFLPDSLKLDKDIIQQAILYDAKCFEQIDDCLKKDIEFVSKCIEIEPFIYPYIHESLKTNFELALKAVEKDGETIVFIQPPLKNNRRIVEKAIQTNYYSMQYVPNEYKENKAFVLPILKKSPSIYQFLSDDLKRSKQIVMLAIQKESNVNHIPKDLLYTKHVLFKIIKENPKTYLELSEIFHQDKDIKEYYELITGNTKCNENTYFSINDFSALK